VCWRAAAAPMIKMARMPCSRVTSITLCGPPVWDDPAGLSRCSTARRLAEMAGGGICPSVVQDHVQQRAVDAQTAVVFDKPELAEFVHKKLTRDRVVPIIPAKVSWLTLGITASGLPSFPKLANSKRRRAKRFSLELKS
jgi:hypothetical protein